MRAGLGFPLKRRHLADFGRYKILLSLSGWRFGVPEVVTTKIAVFENVAPCTVVEGYDLFRKRAISFFHLQGRRIVEKHNDGFNV